MEDSPILITSTDLEAWTCNPASEDTLPELIDRLVNASAKKIERIRFPSGKSVSMSGFDGFLSAESDLYYIPDGNSVWELSTREDVAIKAWEDFEKRVLEPESKLPSGFTKANTTYVAVSLRRWHDRSDIEKKIKKDLLG